MKRHIAVVLAALVTACTPTPTEPPPRVTTTPTVTSDATTTSSTAPQPFEYRVGVTDDVTTLNPWALGRQDLTATTGYVLWRTAVTLYRARTDTIGVSALAAGTSLPEPVEQDGGTWTVEIGTQGTWSDGEPITPADVAFTFDTVRRLGLSDSWAAWFPDSVESITADGDTLTITFDEAPGLSVWPFAVGLAPIMPAHHWRPLVDAVDAADDLYALDAAGAPSGGSFEIVGRTAGEETRLSARPEWPGWEADPAIETLTYAVYENQESALDALRVGDLDLVIDPDGLAPDSASGLATPQLATMTSPTNGFRFIAFNFKRSITDLAAFRQAVALIAASIDRPEGAGLGGGVTISVGNRPWYDDERAATLVDAPADWVGASVSELEKAGFAWQTKPTAATPGAGLTFNGGAVRPLEILVPAEDPIREAFVAEVAERVRQIGFDVRISELPLEQVVERVFTPAGEGFDFDMFAAGWNLGTPEFPRHYQAFFGTPSATSGQNNNTGFSDESVDGLIAELATTRDPTRARSLAWDIETALERLHPYVVLYTEQIIEAYRSDRIGFPFEETLGGLQAGGGAPELVEPVR